MFEKIKKVRCARGMTQEDLVEKSGVSRSTIINLENGKLTNTHTDTIVSIAVALGVSPSIFFE